MTENTTNVVLPKGNKQGKIKDGTLTAGPIKEIYDAKGKRYEMNFPGEKKIEMKPLGKDEPCIEIPLENNRRMEREAEVTDR